MNAGSQEPHIAAESWGFGKHRKNLVLHKKDSDGKFKQCRLFRLSSSFQNETLLKSNLFYTGSFANTFFQLVPIQALLQCK